MTAALGYCSEMADEEPAGASDRSADMRYQLGSKIVIGALAGLSGTVSVQQLLGLQGYRFNRIGFRYDDSLDAKSIECRRTVRGTRYKDQLDLRMIVARPKCQRDAVGPAWHLHIGDYEINLRSSFYDFHRSIPRPRFSDMKPDRFEMISKRHTNDRLIFDNQDRALAQSHNHL